MRTKRPSPQAARSGRGDPLSISGLYRVLSNPFYAGILEWEGHVHRGKHVAAVSVEDFDRIQRRMGRKDAPRPQRHEWAYTGLLKCTCGLSITASHSKNRFGSRYTYYHCTRRRGIASCREPWTPVAKLEEQLEKFIHGLMIDPKIQQWVLRSVEAGAANTAAALAAKRAGLTERRDTIEKAQRNLRHLRTHDQISEPEFLEDRAAFEKDRISIEQQLEALAQSKAFEPEIAFLKFSIHAAKWFRKGDDATRRLIIKTAGLNPGLKAGNLNIDARLPFRRWKNPADFSEVSSQLNDVRTLCDDERLRELCEVAEKLVARAATIEETA